MKVRAPESEGEASIGSWYVADGYHVAPEQHSGARQRGWRVLVIDDLGAVGRYDADVVLDQNLGSSEDTYAATAKGAELLIGSRFALLRRGFSDAADATPHQHAEASVTTLALAAGGAPTPEVDRKVAEIARAVASAGIEPKTLRGVKDVPGFLRNADVALAAAGSTAWELACCGVPSLLFSVTTNQLPVASALASEGAAIDLGWWQDLDPALAASSIRELTLDQERRRAMATAGRRVVDGRGARRVVNYLRSFDVALHAAKAEDARRLWEWANDSAVRSASFSSDPIPWDDHLQWLEGSLADPAVYIWIASGADDGQTHGQVRLSVVGDHAEIGLSVEATSRGRGWAPRLIAAGVRRLFAEEPTVCRVDALVRPENEGSRRAFLDAGFVLRGREKRQGADALRFTRDRP